MDTNPEPPPERKPRRRAGWIRVLILALIGGVFAYEGQLGVAVLAWGVAAVVWWISREIDSRRGTPN
ncbi:MAG: hypothetical protein ACKVS6_12985 [Planctomycetota bacterium]